MNPVKLYIAKEILSSAKDAYDKHKQKSSGSGRGNYYPGPSSNGYGYGYSPQPCQCQCGHGGRMKGQGGPMQFISSIKNSKHVQSLPQTLQGLAAMRHGNAGHGGVKKMIPNVLKGLKSRI